MDKYRTSELGKALKKVFHGEMTVDGSVALAKEEISQVFEQAKSGDPAADTDIGLYMDKIGICPLCGSTVIRGKYSYGCLGYKEKGCKFRLNLRICGRTIPVSAAKRLLETGTTGKLTGFISKNGKNFDGALKLEGERAVFDFS